MSTKYQAYLPAHSKFQADFKKLRTSFVKANKDEDIFASQIAYLCLEAFRNMEPDNIDLALGKYKLARSHGKESTRIKNDGGINTINMDVAPVALARSIRDRMLVEFNESYNIRELFIAGLILAFDLKKSQLKLLLEAYNSDPVN